MADQGKVRQNGALTCSEEDFGLTSALRRVLQAALITYRLTHHAVISVLAALALGSAARIWYLGSVAELYALNTFYLALFLYLIILWHQTKEKWLFWAATVVYAVSFGNHTSMIL